MIELLVSARRGTGDTFTMHVPEGVVRLDASLDALTR